MVFLVSVSQRSEEQLLHDPVYDWAISNHSSIAIFSNASPVLTV
jgi:hypothetical protein